MNPYRPTLDRIIPDKGYITGNVQIVISWYNRFKSDLTDIEALAILRQWALNSGFVERKA
jgi:hypothetical protein